MYQAGIFNEACLTFGPLHSLLKTLHFCVLLQKRRVDADAVVHFPFPLMPYVLPEQEVVPEPKVGLRL